MQNLVSVQENVTRFFTILWYKRLIWYRPDVLIIYIYYTHTYSDEPTESSTLHSGWPQGKTEKLWNMKATVLPTATGARRLIQELEDSRNYPTYSIKIE